MTERLLRWLGPNYRPRNHVCHVSISSTVLTTLDIAYAVLGGFISIFSLLSLFIKERLYIGEATVAMLVGIIFGPVAANIFDPYTWGNADYITLEVSRIVIVVQVFAIGVELPKKYFKRHWRGIAIMLLPVMTTSWFVCAGLIYALIPKLNFVESLVVAATLAPTDPVLASSVVGKGKFAERVPGHIRNLLSCESGCNDGMAFPFLYLGLYIILDVEVKKTTKEWILITILYECLLGIVVGILIGFAGRYAIRYAEEHKLIDRESFLVFYFVLALFCTGLGTVIGVDDFLVAFAAGTAFAWDGWFSRKTEESHVSNVIDLLLNMAFFVYFGAIIPWSQFNAPDLSITPWRLVVLSILILIFRRIPAVFACFKFNPDIRTWREALFCGHFGPMGVGAIFFAILARAELETESQVPAGRLPGSTEEHGLLINAIYPIVTFVVLSSIIVHGSSIAVFTLGKHINTNLLPSMSMTFTRGRNSEDDGPNWLNRLPRLELGHSMTFSKSKERSRSVDRVGGHIDRNAIGTATKPKNGRRRRAEKEDGHSKRRSPSSDKLDSDRNEKNAEPMDDDERTPGEKEAEKQYQRESQDLPDDGHIHEEGQQVFREGDDFIIEDDLGEVIKVISNPEKLSTGAAHNLLDKEHIMDGVSREKREDIATDPSHPLYKRLGGFISNLSKTKQQGSGDKVSDRSDSSGKSTRGIEKETSMQESEHKSQIRGADKGKGKTIEILRDDDQETSAERKRRRSALGTLINDDDDVIEEEDDEDQNDDKYENDNDEAQDGTEQDEYTRDDHETPAERKRRLQALGHSVEDDSGDLPQGFSSSGSESTTAGKQVDNAAAVPESANRGSTISFHRFVDSPNTESGHQNHASDGPTLGADKASLTVPPQTHPRSTSNAQGRSIVWADSAPLNRDNDR